MNWLYASTMAWRVGAQGNALEWWIERLANEKAIKALLESSRRAYARRGGRSVTAASSLARVDRRQAR